ncbi:MAG: S8 family peptidase [candidate division Zixibacteria bacterium]|nr:S8 family peptidase [candidate division Zixibacteria bacterium]
MHKVSFRIGIQHSRHCYHPIISLLLCFALLIFASTVQGQSKLSDRLLFSLAQNNSSTLLRVWVFVDNSAIDRNPITLSDEALKRRARVDPTGFLINRMDYSVSSSAIETVRAKGVKILGVSRWLKAISVEASSNQVYQLAALPFVAKMDIVRTFVQSVPDRIIPLRQSPGMEVSDSSNYGGSFLQNNFVGAIKLHQAGLTGQGVRIAMFDTGFNPDHEAFDSTSVIGAWDFVNNDSCVSEPDCEEEPSGSWQTRHGTITWGVIAAWLQGELIGVASEADFLLAQTEITCGDTEIKREEDNWIMAAEWADSAGADIISCSLGYYEFTDSDNYEFNDLDGDTPLITKAADIAASKNILVVTAAGNMRNNSWGHILTPADGDSVIAVGAVNADSTLAAFSSPGPTADGRIKPDITTLGVRVLSVSHIGGLTAASGTSLSTPLIAGCAALALQHDSSLTADELRTSIKQSGNRTSAPDNDFGNGLFDAVKTADIIHLNVPEMIEAEHDNFVSVLISTDGRSDRVPDISAFNLPIGVSFVDNQDGTGQLNVLGSTESPPTTNVGIVADVGYFADTAFITITNLAASQRLIFAGPNPFSDSICVFVSPDAGFWISVNVFNSAGEKVWERVNNSPSPSDVVIRWHGCNEYGANVANGVYIIRVCTEKLTSHIKALKVD